MNRMTPNNPQSDEQYYGPAATVASRDADYGPIEVTYDRVAELWRVLTDGAPVHDAIDVMLMWVLTKLVRFWHSGKTHRDSIHDAQGYCLGIERAVANAADASARMRIALRDSEAADVEGLLGE